MPITIGALSAILTAWDVYNWKIISSMGMAWDTGAPIWPYQTSDILLRFIDYPAFLAATPLASFLNLLAPNYHLVVFPVGLVWWWLVGLWLDRRSLNRPHRRRWSIFIPITICCGLLAIAAIFEGAKVFQWYLKYGGDLLSVNKLGMLRFITPAIWLAAAAAVLALAAKANLVGRYS